LLTGAHIFWHKTKNRLAKQLAVQKKLFGVKSCRKTGHNNNSLTPKIQIEFDKLAITEPAEKCH
jgi:hypothetical protein